MNKLEIMKESYNYRGAYIKEDYVLSNFVKGFISDLKYYGEDAVGLYKVLFGLNEEIDFLFNNRIQINEAIKSTKRPFLFEGVMDKGNNYLFEAKAPWWDTTEAGNNPLSLLKKKAAPAPIEGSSAASVKRSQDKWERLNKNEPAKSEPSANLSDRDVKELQAKQDSTDDVKASEPTPVPYDDGEGAGVAMHKEVSKSMEGKTIDNDWQELAAQKTPEAQAELKGMFTKATDNDISSEEAVKILGGDVGGAASMAKGAAAPHGFLETLLSGVGGAWNRIKSFFGGGAASIGDAVSHGNFAALPGIPLFATALAVGGAALAAKLASKLFGKKVPEKTFAKA